MELLSPHTLSPDLRVTFYDHSSFLLELPELLLLFDYQTKTLPRLPEGKPLLIFVSHHHTDHFYPGIFTLYDETRPVRFLLGNDIRIKPWSIQRWGLTPEVIAACQNLRGGQSADPFPGVHVDALPSTDKGVAFLIQTGGYTLYHAGDLNWWYWPQQDKALKRNMEVNFKRYVDFLRGRHIDLAMLPLDPDLEDAAEWGMEYLLNTADVHYVLPMHQWDEYDLTEKVCRRSALCRRHILPITHEGQVFLFRRDAPPQ